MIITICSSHKFDKEIVECAHELEEEGNIVIMPCLGSESKRSKKDHMKVQMQKIMMSDAIYVLNKGGYIGESVTDEIAFAEVMNKMVMYYTSEGLEGKKVSLSKVEETEEVGEEPEEACEACTVHYDPKDLPSTTSFLIDSNNDYYDKSEYVQKKTILDIQNEFNTSEGPVTLKKVFDLFDVSHNHVLYDESDEIGWDANDDVRMGCDILNDNVREITLYNIRVLCPAYEKENA